MLTDERNWTQHFILLMCVYNCNPAPGATVYRENRKHESNKEVRTAGRVQEGVGNDMEEENQQIGFLLDSIIMKPKSFYAIHKLKMK